MMSSAAYLVGAQVLLAEGIVAVWKRGMSRINPVINHPKTIHTVGDLERKDTFRHMIHSRPMSRDQIDSRKELSAKSANQNGEKQFEEAPTGQRGES